MTARQLERVRAQHQRPEQQFAPQPPPAHHLKSSGQSGNENQDDDEEEYLNSWPMKCICKLCDCGGHRCSTFGLETTTTRQFSDRREGGLTDDNERGMNSDERRGLLTNYERNSQIGNELGRATNEPSDCHHHHHHCNYAAANERYLTRPTNEQVSKTMGSNRPQQTDRNKASRRDDDDDELGASDDQGHDDAGKEQHQLLHVLITKPEIASKPRDNIVFEGDMDLKTTFETSYDALARLRLDHWKRYQETSGQRQQTKSGEGVDVSRARKSPISRKHPQDHHDRGRFGGGGGRQERPDASDDDEEQEEANLAIVGQRKQQQQQKFDVSVESSDKSRRHPKSQGAGAVGVSRSTFSRRNVGSGDDGEDDEDDGDAAADDVEGPRPTPLDSNNDTKPNRGGRAKSQHRARPRRDVVGAKIDNNHADEHADQPQQRARLLTRVESLPPPQGVQLSNGGGGGGAGNTLVSNKLETDKRKQPLISSKPSGQRTARLADENLPADATQEANTATAAAAKRSVAPAAVAPPADRRSGSGLANVETNISQRSAACAPVATTPTDPMGAGRPTAQPIRLQRDSNEAAPPPPPAPLPLSATLNDDDQRQQQQLKSTYIDPDLSSIIVYDANMNRLERVGLRKRSKYRPSTSLKSGARGLFGDQKEQEATGTVDAGGDERQKMIKQAKDKQQLTAAGLPISRGRRSRQDGVLSPINDSNQQQLPDQPLTYSEQNLPIDSKRRFADNVNMTDHLNEQTNDESVRLKRLVSKGTLTDPIGGRDHEILHSDNNNNAAEMVCKHDAIGQQRPFGKADHQLEDENEMRTMLRLAEQEEAAAVEEIRRCTSELHHHVPPSNQEQAAQQKQQQQHPTDGVKSVNSNHSNSILDKQSKLQRTCQSQSFYLFENDYPEPKEQHRQHELTAIGFGTTTTSVSPAGSSLVASRAVNHRRGDTTKNLFRESPDFMLTTGRRQQQQQQQNLMSKREANEMGNSDDLRRSRQSNESSSRADNYPGSRNGNDPAADFVVHDTTADQANNNQSFLHDGQDGANVNYWSGDQTAAAHNSTRCKVFCLDKDFEFVGSKMGHKYFVEKQLSPYECDH